MSRLPLRRERTPVECISLPRVLYYNMVNMSAHNSFNVTLTDSVTFCTVAAAEWNASEETPSPSLT